MSKTAQTLLWRAYQEGVTIRLNGGDGLRVTPASDRAKALIPAVREHKRELMALLADLEQYDAQDDPLILEALALFNARLTGITRKEPETRQMAFDLVA
jgi:hypothetical protein